MVLKNSFLRLESIVKEVGEKCIAFIRWLNTYHILGIYLLRCVIFFQLAFHGPPTYLKVKIDGVPIPILVGKSKGS